MATGSSLATAAAPQVEGSNRALSRYPSTRLERGLLALIIALVPFQNRVTPFAGISVVWVAFVAVGAVVLLRRPRAMFRVAMHRLLIPVYAFLVLALMMELPHPHASPSFWWRIVQMVLGGVLLGVMCRDRRAVRTAMQTIVVVASCVALLFTLSTYGPLRNSTATSFQEVSQVRADTLSESTLSVGLNSSGFLMGLGSGVAMALGLGEASRRRKRVFLGLAALCLLAVFLSLSRGGMATALVSIGVVLASYSRPRRRVKTLMAAGALVVLLVMLLPGTVFSRVSVSGGADRVEPREVLYRAAAGGFGEFAVFGVGSGNYYEDWGWVHGFAQTTDFRRVQGAHNGFVQLWIFWGVLGLGSFVIALWKLYRSLPPRRWDPLFSLGLRALGAALLVDLLVSHTVYAKEYSVGLGLLLGTQVWMRDGRSEAPRGRPLVSGKAS